MLPSRRLESLENQTEQVAKGVAEIQEVSATRTEALKGRFSGIEKALREVQRGVQLVRDKQVGRVSDGSTMPHELERRHVLVERGHSLFIRVGYMLIAQCLFGVQELAEAQADLAKLSSSFQVS